MQVMRVLYDRYGETGEGVPENGVQAVAAELTDLDLDAFFEEALQRHRRCHVGATVGLWTAWVSTPCCAPRGHEGPRRQGGQGQGIHWADRGDLGVLLRPSGTKDSSFSTTAPPCMPVWHRATTIIAMNHIKAGADLPRPRWAKMAGSRGRPPRLPAR